MHVVFISNCEKKAWTRTRTLLDRYATRIGERAWITPITSQALNEIFVALKRHASRHTSVACYRNDAVGGMRLVWTVGNRDFYDGEGRFAVATRSRKKEIPMFLRHASLVSALAGYMHDFGKASRFFANKLKSGAYCADPCRHEWLSAHLIRIMKKKNIDMTPDGFIAAWGELSKMTMNNLREFPVDKGMKSLVDAAVWAVCTHHGAVGGQWSAPSGASCERHVCAAIDSFTLNEHADNRTLNAEAFCKDAADISRWKDLFKVISKVSKRLEGIGKGGRYAECVMLAARAALILADHKVSSMRYGGMIDDQTKKRILFANTKEENSVRSVRGKKGSPKRVLDQPLSWHLMSVGEAARRNVRMIAGDGLPSVEKTLVRAMLANRAEDGSRYAWQDRASDAVAKLPGGKLVFNVASTGAGKTLGNLKMAFAMRDDVRLAVAFNLRSLTTQTFEAFRKKLVDIDRDAFDRDFACLIGERHIPASETSLSDNDDGVLSIREDSEMVELAPDIDGGRAEMPGWLNDIAGKDDKLVRLVSTPVLVSTMDWIVAAGEPGQQHRHAKALIRVANSDLILDEVDSYDIDAVVAIMRVVEIAAMYGRNVIVSSATLNPALARGLIAAYKSGRDAYREATNEDAWSLVVVHDQMQPRHVLSPCIDQGDAFYREVMKDASSILLSHPATKRYRIRQIGRIAEDDSVDSVIENVCKAIADEAESMHGAHAFIPDDLSCRLSIGLVRIANIQNCIKVAEHLRKDSRFIVCAYHAREVDVIRAEREKWLDRILYRPPGCSSWVEALKQIYPEINNATGDVRLIVVATPVEEVGRDHDFDWAIIEPSSMHSIIQTAGRVNRHRRAAVETENIVILSHNMRALTKTKSAAFTLPGLEYTTESWSTHPKHDLSVLMKPANNESGIASNVIDAAMVFDEGGRKTLFAQYDENAISLRIDEGVIKVIGRQPEFETNFMIAGFAESFRLREKSNYVTCIINKDGNGFRIEGMKEKAGTVVVENTPEQTWLCFDMASLSKERHSEVRVRCDGSGPVKLRVKWSGVMVE